MRSAGRRMFLWLCRAPGDHGPGVQRPQPNPELSAPRSAVTEDTCNEVVGVSGQRPTQIAWVRSLNSAIAGDSVVVQRDLIPGVRREQRGAVRGYRFQDRARKLRIDDLRLVELDDGRSGGGRRSKVEIGV